MAASATDFTRAGGHIVAFPLTHDLMRMITLSWRTEEEMDIARPQDIKARNLGFDGLLERDGRKSLARQAL
jgi:hypothetical protein